MNSPPRVLLRSEETDGRIALIESTMPAGAAGPPLHTHAFDETFYVLEGELTFQVGNEVRGARAGEVAFALGGVPHTLANQAHCLTSPSDRPRVPSTVSAPPSARTRSPDSTL